MNQPKEKKVFGKQLWVNRTDISRLQWQQLERPQLEDGELELHIEEFAFTANNITYAVMGDFLQYWEFFAANDGYGIVPVWGFATVTASKHSDINVGEKIYGYFPMSEYIHVKPGSVSASSFDDVTQHRQALPMVYNQYLRCQSDPLYQEKTEALQMLMRPLFTTSFLIDDFFREANSFSAEQMILSSASSKTSIAMAYVAKQMQAANPGEAQAQGHLIGLTSTANKSFVESLNLYDEVLSYDEIEIIDKRKSIYIDFSGNGDLRASIHNYLSDLLLYSCMVGASHWDKTAADNSAMAGPEPVMFFAPSQAQKRIKEWGGEEFARRLATQWNTFTGFAAEWMTVKHISDDDAIAGTYSSALQGNISASDGLILSIK